LTIIEEQNDLKPKAKTPGKTGDEKKKNFDHDGLFKDIIVSNLYAFIKKMSLVLYAALDTDTDRKPTYYDTEFRDVVNSSNQNFRNTPYFADFVISVPLDQSKAKELGFPLKNIESKRFLLHIEAQGEGGGDLTWRMYNYHSLIVSHFGEIVWALALIIKKRPTNEPVVFFENKFGEPELFSYHRIDISKLNYKELLESNEPLDLILSAASFIYGKENIDQEARYTYLREIMPIFDRKPWKKWEKKSACLFVERIVNLTDEQLQQKYYNFWEQRKKGKKAVYISIYDRFKSKELKEEGIQIGLQKGLQKGRQEGHKIGLQEGIQIGQEGLLKTARNLLAAEMSPKTVAKMTGLPLKTIKGLKG
jgi:predicted transposase/invertase (TIGR01784 family)